MTIWIDWDAYRVNVKRHGRLAYTIPLMGDTFVDLSVMPCKDLLGGDR